MTGPVIETVSDTHNSGDFIEFLNKFDAARIVVEYDRSLVQQVDAHHAPDDARRLQAGVD